MKTDLSLILWLSLLWFLTVTGCADSDLLKDYQAEQPRILAIRIQEPEAEPGDTVEMQLLVGGRDVSQDMTQPVDWYLQTDPPTLLGTASYDQPLATVIPQDALPEALTWRDFLISARLQVNGKPLTAQKYLRVTSTPKGRNPRINSVQVRFRENNELILKEIKTGDTIAIAHPGRDVAFSAVTAVLPEGENERLVFQWQAAVSSNSSGKLFVEPEQAEIDKLLPAGREASDSHPDVVFCLKGEKGDDPLQSGLYHIYLVVRDNAFNSASRAEERFGTDFFYFNLCVGNNCGNSFQP